MTDEWGPQRLQERWLKSRNLFYHRGDFQGFLLSAFVRVIYLPAAQLWLLRWETLRLFLFVIRAVWRNVETEMLTRTVWMFYLKWDTQKVRANPHWKSAWRARARAPPSPNKDPSIKNNPGSRYYIGQYSYKLIKPSWFLNHQSQFWSKTPWLWYLGRSKVPRNPEYHQILTISSLACYQHFTKICTKLPVLLCSQITAGYHLLTTEGASGARGGQARVSDQHWAASGITEAQTFQINASLMLQFTPDGRDIKSAPKNWFWMPLTHCSSRPSSRLISASAGSCFLFKKKMRGEKPEYLCCCALATSGPGVCWKAVESVNTHQRLCISCFYQSSLSIHEARTRWMAQLGDIEQIIQSKEWVFSQVFLLNKASK